MFVEHDNVLTYLTKTIRDIYIYICLILFFKTDVNEDVDNTILSKIFRDGDELHDTRNYVDVVTRRVCIIATKNIKS